MSAFIITRIQVGDYATWRPMFDQDGPRAREKAKSQRVFRSIDDPNHVFIQLEFDSAEDAKEASRRLSESGVLDRFDDKHGPTVVVEADFIGEKPRVGQRSGMTPERRRRLAFLQARKRSDEPRFADCSALRWVGLVLRVGVVWIVCGACHRVAWTAAALADGLAGGIRLAATTSPSLSLRPADRRRDASPLCGVAATRRSRHDLLAYGDGLRL